MFPKDNYFLQLLAYGRDKSQKYHIIKFINKSQYYLLKKIAKNILEGVIPLKKNQLKHLGNSKIFIRKLAEGKVKNSDLLRYYTITCYIVKIALEHYETHSKISTSSNRKMGRNRRQECCMVTVCLLIMSMFHMLPASTFRLFEHLLAICIKAEKALHTEVSSACLLSLSPPSLISDENDLSTL